MILQTQSLIWVNEGKKVKKCKGVKKKTKMNVIHPRDDNIYIETVNKIALSCEDDKRIIREDGIHTLAPGHYSLV